MAQVKQYKSGISVVWTESNDAEGFCELIRQSHQADPAAIALIYYSAEAVSPNYIISYMQSHCDDLSYSGCSTCGEISPEGIQDCGAVAVLLPASKFTALAEPIEDVHRAGMNRIAQQASEQRIKFDELCSTSNAENTFAVTFIDGLTESEEAVTAALHRGLGGIAHIGGSAADGQNFKKTTQMCNGRLYSNAAILILIKSGIPFQLCTENNFVTTGDKLVVTEANPDTRTVYEFNAEPAALVYAKAIGVGLEDLGPNCFASNPVVVKAGGEYHCRAMQRLNSDLSVTFYSAIDNGVVLSIAKTQGMEESMRQCIQRIESEIGAVDMMMGFECILRKIDAQHRNAIGRVGKLYMENNIVAINVYGEQYQSIHINQTFTGVAFGMPVTNELTSDNQL